MQPDDVEALIDEIGESELEWIIGHHTNQHINLAPNKAYLFHLRKIGRDDDTGDRDVRRDLRRLGLGKSYTEVSKICLGVGRIPQRLITNKLDKRFTESLGRDVKIGTAHNSFPIGWIDNGEEGLEEEDFLHAKRLGRILSAQLPALYAGKMCLRQTTI
jgi:hypothetical protein